MDESQEAPRKRGRPRTKGTRTKLTGYVPEDHGVIYERRRKALGLSEADFIALRLAQAEGLAIPTYIANVIDISSARPQPHGGGAVAI